MGILWPRRQDLPPERVMVSEVNPHRREVAAQMGLPSSTGAIQWRRSSP